VRVGVGMDVYNHSNENVRVDFIGAISVDTNKANRVCDVTRSYA